MRMKDLLLSHSEESLKSPGRGGGGGGGGGGEKIVPGVDLKASRWGEC